MADISKIQAELPVGITGLSSSGVPTTPVASDVNGNLLVKDYADGPVTPGTVATASILIGGQFNTILPTLTAAQQVALQVDSSGRVIIRPLTSADIVSAVQSGTWNINNISGTISLPTGAATAANQATEITSLQLMDNIIGPVTPGTVATASALIGGQYNVTAPAPTNGQQVSLQVDNEGRLITAPIQVSPLPASGSKFSFGGVGTASTAQVPVNATAYTEVITNVAMTLVSSSAADTAAGTGARTVSITYYDQNMTGPQVVIITTNGTTVVTSPNNNMAYIEKVIVATVGTGTSNAGTLTLKSGATTVATIPIGQNLTAWAHHYVPQGKTSYISGFCCGASGTSAGQSATFVLKASTPTIANTPEVQISDFIQVTGAGNSVIRNYNSPIQIVGPARITAYVSPGATSAYTSYASFDYIDN